MTAQRTAIQRRIIPLYSPDIQKVKHTCTFDIHRTRRSSLDSRSGEYSARFCHFAFDSWDRMHGFIDAYRATMQRVSANDFYRFPESYFRDLREALGNQLHLCTIQAPDGEMAAGSLFTLVNGIAQDHLSATNDKYLGFGASKLMIYPK